MTLMEVSFRYGLTPGEREMVGINRAREVYGVRAIRFDEGERIITVEYDATRLTEEIVISLLKRAGIDLKTRIAMA